MIDSPYTLGIDIGGTNIKVVAVTCDGLILSKSQFSTLDSKVSDYGADIRGRLETLETELGHPLRIGVAAPGLVDVDHRYVTWMRGRMEAICGIEWTQALGSTSKVPVLNDAKAALLAESWIGVAKGLKNALLLTLGTGVGGAALVDGRLLHGGMGRAGHLGHISLDPGGLPDIVRTPGSLEDQVGDATLESRSSGKFLDTRILLEAVSEGDALAMEIWNRSIRALAAGIVSLINVLDPAVVILGGGIAGAGSRLFEPLQAAVAEMEWRPFGSGVPIVAASLGEYAGAVGAARFAMTYDTDRAPGESVHERTHP